MFFHFFLLVALCVLCELCVSVVKTSLAAGYNQWFTDYHHRDTERTEDSQRTRLFDYSITHAKQRGTSQTHQDYLNHSAEQRDWLRDHPEIDISKLFQQTIRNQMMKELYQNNIR